MSTATTKATAKTTAEATYRDRQKDIGSLLDWIGQEIKMHGEYAEKEGFTWGRVGDLQHYQEKLTEILAGLVGSDSEKESRKMIQDALAEAKA